MFDNFSYPELSACAGIEGKVIVRFKVDLTGNIADVELIKGLDESIDEEVLSVIRSAPGLTGFEEERLKREAGNLRHYLVTFRLSIKFKIMK
jgi:TonB family protein